jgi:predicted nuclease of predicted toxin-antitoxin system
MAVRTAAIDEEILARALREGRIVVSADTDFGAILVAQESEHLSFILFRNPNLLVAHNYLNMLLPALGVPEPELASGCVGVFRHGRLRVRKLPFSA